MNSLGPIKNGPSMSQGFEVGCRAKTHAKGAEVAEAYEHIQAPNGAMPRFGGDVYF